MSIGTNGLHPAAAAYFKHQRLISGSGSEQALGLIERTLVVKHRPTKVELPWPVHRPVPCQVVLLLHWADGQVAGGNLHFLNVDASGPSWDHDHGVIFFTHVWHERRQSQNWIKGEYSPQKYPCRKNTKRSPFMHKFHVWLMKQRLAGLPLVLCWRVYWPLKNLQVELSPLQTPHASREAWEPRIWSQPTACHRSLQSLLSWKARNYLSSYRGSQSATASRFYLLFDVDITTARGKRFGSGVEVHAVSQPTQLQKKKTKTKHVATFNAMQQQWFVQPNMLHGDRDKTSVWHHLKWLYVPDQLSVGTRGLVKHMISARCRS